jgi:hypothetical protein
MFSPQSRFEGGRGGHTIASIFHAPTHLASLPASSHTPARLLVTPSPPPSPPLPPAVNPFPPPSSPPPFARCDPSPLPPSCDSTGG